MTGRGRRRCADDRGAALVAGIAIMFSFTFLGLVWLANDVDRAISNESAAQSIAFQAARTAAQTVSVSDLRGGALVLDPSTSCARGASAAARLLDSYGVVGAVDRCTVDDTGTKVTVVVSITDGGRTVRGTGIVTAERTD